MFPPKFDYHRANSIEEAVSLMQQQDYAKFLAGGHSLIPAMNLRLADPGVIIDIGRIDGLKGVTREDGRFYVGALTTHAQVAEAGDLPAIMPEAAGWIGDPQVRNRGTIGGNVAHADPASDWPTVLLALDATFHISGPGGTRTVNAADFFVDLFATALEDGDLLTAVSVPAEGANTGSAYAKMFNPASRYAMVGAAAQVTVENGTYSAASVAVGGLTPTATAAPSVVEALVGQPATAETIAAAAEKVTDDLGDEVMGDIHASAEYRRHMAVVYVKRALTAATERAQG